MRLQILIPVASIVSSCIALSVIWWATQRRKEREAYYRYELSRVLVEKYAAEPERFLAWEREQREQDVVRRRDAIRILIWVLLLGGVGTLVGLGFTTKDESLFAWVPIGVALGLSAYLGTTHRSQPR